MAEPSVRAGVWEHSSFRKDPIGRLRRTGLAAMVTVYGARSVAEPMIAGVVRRHAAVDGETSAGIRYAANDPRLLEWVHATAAFSFAEAYSRYVAALSPCEFDGLYQEGTPAARLYGAVDTPQSVGAMNDLFESMSVFNGRGLRIGGDAKPRLLIATSSDSGFFDVLGVKPELGRFFTQDECQPGRDAVIVLSHGFAQTYFGSPGEALGKQLQLGDRAVLVIGVMPPQFQMKSWFPMSTEGWMPIAWTEKDRATRGIHNWLVAARLRPGVTVAQAQSAMDVISNRLARDYPGEDKGWGAVVRPLRDYLVGDVRLDLFRRRAD